MNDSKNNIKKLKEAIKHDIVHTWFNNIKKNKKFFLSDSTGVNIKARKVLTGVILMQEFLKKKIPQKENNIATIIPTSVAGSLVNIALLNLGKTVCHLNYTSDLNSLDNSIKISNANTLITSKKFISILNDKGFNLSNSIAKLNIVYLEDLKTYANTFKKIKYYLLTCINS
jgi:acyl-[acyl-carrier-protein]-phospholipid O-acyltransferase/long-chain-fatty-acid--[acyl-carrier-protein] ligase